MYTNESLFNKIMILKVPKMRYFRGQTKQVTKLTLLLMNIYVIILRIIEFQSVFPILGSFRISIGKL